MPLQGLIRTGFLCNQDCGFCWQDRDWPTFDPEQILTWIEDLHEQGARRLIVSGGEPTLDRSLFQYLERATALGLHVTLETNAMRMAQPGFVERLSQAAPGFDAFVSLHSPDAAVSDRATRAPGTHAKTVKGIRAMLEAGVRVKLNAVISSDTIETLVDLPDFVHAEFRARPSFRGVMISLPQTPFDQALDGPLRAPPESIRGALPKVIDRAAALGIELDGLAGPCGPPLCAFGADRRVTDLQPIPHTVDFREYLSACDTCSVREACFGVHRSDREVFGDRCAVSL
jgi:MoaA/NifB/PqqE/SkfB family radical SAM enzyme